MILQSIGDLYITGYLYYSLMGCRSPLWKTTYGTNIL